MLIVGMLRMALGLKPSSMSAVTINITVVVKKFGYMRETSPTAHREAETAKAHRG